jgi:hypothetical protein
MYTLFLSAQIDLAGQHSDLFAVFDSENAFAIVNENADGLFVDVDPDNNTLYAFVEVRGEQVDYGYGKAAVHALIARNCLIVNNVCTAAVAKQLAKMV